MQYPIKFPLPQNAVAQIEGFYSVYSVTGKIDLVAIIEVKDHCLALT